MFFWGTLFSRKLYLKNFNIQNKDNKISQGRGNSLRNEVRGWIELCSPDPLKPLPCFSSQYRFLFCWAAFLSISLLASVFPVSLPPTLLDSCANAWMGKGFCSWTHFLAFMEWANAFFSRPVAWSYVPVQYYSCSLRVFYRTLVVGKDTY